MSKPGQLLQQLLQNLFHIPAQLHIGSSVFVDFGMVDIHVDDLFALLVFSGVAGCTVGKTDAQSDNKITFAEYFCRTFRTVHTAHPQIQRLIRRKGGQTHHAEGHRSRDMFRQSQQLCTCSGGNHSAAGVDKRTNRSFYQIKCRSQIRIRQSVEKEFLTSVFTFVTHIGLDAFGYIHQHRTGSAGNSDFECGIQYAIQILYCIDGKVVLDYLLRNSGDVHLLKTVSAQKRNCHIAGDGDQRDAVQIGVGNTGNQIGRTGAAGGDDHTGFAGNPGKTIGGVGGILFMGAQNVIDAVGIFIQLIIDGQNRSAGITENGVGTIAAQCFNNDRCS